MSTSPITPVPDAPVSLRAHWKTSVLVALCCFIVYNANLRAISAGDTYPARYIPFAVVQHGTVLIDPVAKITAQGRRNSAFWMVSRPDGHIVSLYPVVLPVLVSPLYVPVVGYLNHRGATEGELDHAARVMEKLSASLIASLSAALMFLVLRRRASSKVALLLTAAYAFGTTTWMIGSQALWQHGMAELLLAGALLLVTGRCTLWRVFAVGLLCGLLAGNRPPDALLAAAIGAYALIWAGWRRMPLLAIGGMLPFGLVLLYNIEAVGNIGGGYGLLGKAVFFSHDLLQGLAAILFSPMRGLFVFSPFLLFIALAWRHLPRSREERALTLAAVIAIALQLVIYAKADWRGGMSWGPRYMTDFLPLLVWMLAPIVSALRGIGKVCFVCAVAVSIVIEAIGAFWYTGELDSPLYAGDTVERQKMSAAWNWRNTAFLTAPKRDRAPGELLMRKRGVFDGFEAGGRVTGAVTAGEKVVATGWALTGNATPYQVAVNIDGEGVAATNEFVDRPDVRALFANSGASGWRIPIDTTGLAPGEHELTAFAWASARGENYYLDARKLTIRASSAPATVAAPADLEEASGKAATRVRDHQQPAGYWLTAFTSETRFVDPHPEMNTFLTAVLVDLLDPIGSLHDSVQRARTHLTAQIEADGLVRYHGLPDGPGIGTLGCAITPDTDNTALVWRIAPPQDRTRLASALATIERYRTKDGLYRTWLASRENYQCLDPGSDPNPADIAIQMHLLMLLSDVRPAAAHALCEALRPVADQDRVWVYYRKTPLIPMLRLRDVQLDGCAMELPASRMRTGVPDQKIWLSAARLLMDDAPDEVLLRAVLRELARDDFALVRTNPPLLYHNDLTATVPRFYWSEDVGYALWLRLYDRYQHPSDSHRTP